MHRNPGRHSASHQENHQHQENDAPRAPPLEKRLLLRDKDLALNDLGLSGKVDLCAAAVRGLDVGLVLSDVDHGAALFGPERLVVAACGSFLVRLCLGEEGGGTNLFGGGYY